MFKKTLFFYLIIITLFSCDRLQTPQDIALFVASGGILPFTSSAAKKEVKKEVKKVIPDNQPPIVSFYDGKAEMKVGDKKNFLLSIYDPDDDNITKVFYFIENPNLAVLEVQENPYAITVVAKKEGNTNIIALAKDKKGNEGRSEKLSLAILRKPGTGNPEVKFTSTLVEMNINSIYVINYIYKGLQPSYEVTYKSSNSLVTAKINTATTSIELKSGAKNGVEQLLFTFRDSKNLPIVMKVQILVKAPYSNSGGGNNYKPPNNNLPTSPGPITPAPPISKLRETATAVYNDPNACNESYPWSTLEHKYGESRDKTVSSRNSISIQSLTIDETITLYYKELPKIASTPFGIDIVPPTIGLPLAEGKRDSAKKRQFILQANKDFLNSGYFYLRISGSCYRGVFPKSISDADTEKAKMNLKIVINTLK